MAQYPYLRKFIIVILLFLCFATSGVSVSAQDTKSPLWQKIEDARVYMSSNKFPESRSMFEEALDLAVKEKDQAAEAICIGNLGTLCDMTDNTDEAIYYYKKGYDLANRQNNRVLLSKFAGCLVRKYAQKGSVGNARKWLDIQEKLEGRDDPHEVFYMLYNKASVLYLENDPVSALHYLEKAERFAEDNDLGKDLMGAALMGAGDILYKNRKYKEAIEIYHRGLDNIREGGNRSQEIFALRSLYVAYKQAGDSAKASTYRERYNMVADSMYEGMAAESTNERLDNFERMQNKDISNTPFNSSYLLICIIIVLVAIMAFVAVALHRFARGQKKLLDSSEIMMVNSGVPAAETVSSPSPEMGPAGLSSQTASGNGTPDYAEGEDADLNALLALREERTPAVMTYEQQKTLLEKINLVMENVSVISHEDFNLAMLAKAVNSNTKYVSKTINDMCGKTFKTYLNEYRIREACHRLTDKENFGNLTIKAIHQELGFRTTTSFVAAFRKVMGMTPSEYKKMREEGEGDKNK